MEKLKKKIRTILFGYLESRIEDLESKTFKKKDISGTMKSIYNYYLDWAWGDYSAISLEEEIDILQEKVEALEKYLKVEVKHEETDKWVARKIRKKSD